MLTHHVVITYLRGRVRSGGFHVRLLSVRYSLRDSEPTLHSCRQVGRLREPEQENGDVSL